MPKLTDYARQGFRRRRLLRESELPEWWNIAVWAGVGGIVLMLVAGAVFSGDDSAGTTTAQSQAPRYQVQTLDPRGLSASPSPGSTTPGATPTQVLPTGPSAKNFTATAATKIPMTGGGTTVVPAGALNAAMAAAQAAVTGNWKDVPLVGATRPPAKKAMPQGSVVKGISVTDPSMTGNSQYRFSATITHAGGARPDVVELLVEPDGSGYAVRAK
ncbi:hypothetical protein ACQPZP_09310 [Spirillospora sp. CA-142024]|uniref:hypothetical protein n=1 Tax=Spirillospora sp. CA-142024 TaxID=3240036 RepID=UPI003D8EBDC2